MADDHNQRAYRATDASTRGAGGASSGATAGSDPLAELARLIGQTDPFAEYGRGNSGNSGNSGNNGRAGAAPGAQPAPAWPAEPAGYQPEPPALPDLAGYSDQTAYPEQPYAEQPYAAQPYGNGRFGRQTYGQPPLPPAGQPELYPVDAHAPGYASADGYHPGAYANGQPAAYDDAFPPSQEPLHDVHPQFGPAPSDDYYDDVAPGRRRISVMAIAGVFALAVIGTAGALGYRAVFGPSSAPAVPPVIKAEGTPSKVVPAASTKEPGKATDRVGNGQIERLLSREEQPVPVSTTPNQPSGGAAPGIPPAMGSGVVGEPRRIRTIPIRPDQPSEGVVSNAAAEPSPSQPPARVVNAAPVAEPPARPAPAPRAPAPQAAAPAPQAAPPPASNAPLSLNPNAAPARPARVAAQTPEPRATATAGGYSVQVSAQRSEGEAQAAFQQLQGRYPSQLGGRSPSIKRVDLGDKGIYYRAMVVVGSSGEASELCASLKAAGGSCIVQRN